MNRKSKKRLSILKKAIQSEESSPTFTKINRRISFSGTKSIKEFTSDDNKMTIWGKSYEESAEMAQSASHNTIAVDSTISQSITSTTLCSKQKYESVDKENEQINLRNRTILKRKSNVLKAISVEPATYQRDITPNMETVEMDISVNDNDSKPQERNKFLSPKKINNLRNRNTGPNNLTPVPPQKITKFNQTNEGPPAVTVPKSIGPRISDELTFDSCMMATTYDGSHFSIPSRILDKGDINLTYGFNLSEFDLLHAPGRPSENLTSFATKIDRINFSNEDEEPNSDDNSLMPKIQNPQMEQLPLTETAEISDGSRVAGSLRKSHVNDLKQTDVKDPPPKPESPKANPVLEMFKIRNKLKKQMAKQFEEKLEQECFVPFVPVKFETPTMMCLESSITAKNKIVPDLMRPIIKFPMELTKVKQNKQRETIVFTKDSEGLDISISDEDDLILENQNDEVDANLVDRDHGPKSKRTTIHFQNHDLETSIVGQPELAEKQKSACDTIRFPNQEIDMSMHNKTYVNPTREYLIQQSMDKPAEEVIEESNPTQKKLSDRKTIYFHNNDLDITVSTSFEDQIKRIENISSGTNHLPNQIDLETSMASEKQGNTKRGTIHFPNQELEMSTIELATNLEGDNKHLNLKETVKVNEKYNAATKRETIHFPNQDLETSMVVEPMTLIKVIPKIHDEHEARTRRGTVHFPNQQLDMSTVESYPNMEGENRNMNLNEAAKVSGKFQMQTNRGTIHFPNQEIDASNIESRSNDKDENTNLNLAVESKLTTKHKTKRGTIYFTNQALDTSIVVESADLVVAPKIREEHDTQSKRGTVHFPDQQLEISTAESGINVGENRNMPEIVEAKMNKNRERQTQRGTIHFTNHELEISTIETDTNMKGEKINPNLLGAPKVNVKCERLTKRGTIHFPNQALEMSMVESNSNIKGQNGHLNLKIATNASNVISPPIEPHEAQTKRETIYYPNQDLEAKMVIESVSKHTNLLAAHIEREDDKSQSNQGSIHVPNEQLEMSMVEPHPNEKNESRNMKLTVAAKVSGAGEFQTNRGTTHFSNQQLDMSSIESCPNVERDNKHINLKGAAKVRGERRRQANRGTIHFPNQEIETSTIESCSNKKDEYSNLNFAMEPKVRAKHGTKRGTICFANQALDTSMVVETVNLVEVPILREEDEVQSKRGTVYFSDQKLEISTARKVETKINENTERETRRGTIHFPNHELEISTIETDTNMTSTIESCSNKKDEYSNLNFAMEPKVSAKHGTKRGTICFANQALDTSMVVETVNLVEVPILREEDEVQSKRGTVYFSDQQLEISTARKVETKINENTERETRRGTIHFPNHELEISTIETDTNMTSTIESCSKKDEYSNSNFAMEPKVSAKHSTKRGTICFANQALDTSMVVESINVCEEVETQSKQGPISTAVSCLSVGENRKIIETVESKINENRERQTKRVTIHFPNHELDISTIETDTNIKGENVNLNLLRAAKVSEKCERLTKRGTIHFPNQELEMSTVESNSNIHGRYRNLNLKIATTASNNLPHPNGEGVYKNVNLAVASKIREKQVQNELGIDFQNHDLETSMIVEESVCPSLVVGLKAAENHKPQISRGTTHFQNEQSEMSKVESYSNVKSESRNMKLTRDWQTKRGTIHFPNQLLEMSTIESSPIAKDGKTYLNLIVAAKSNEQWQKQTNRGTIHFPDQEIDSNEKSVYKMELIDSKQLGGPTKRGTIYFPNEELETSMVFESVKSKSLTNRNTIHFSNKETEMSKIGSGSKAPHESIYNNNQVPENLQMESKNSNRGTIYYGNENDLEISIHQLKIDSEPAQHSESETEFDITVPGNTSMMRKIYPRTPAHYKKFDGNGGDWSMKELDINQRQPLVPGTISYEDKTLDLSEFVSKDCNSLYIDDEDLDTSEIEPKIELIKQPPRSTIYLPNQGQLDTSNPVEADQMEITTQITANNSLTQARRQFRGTIHYKSDELEMTQISENQSNKTGATSKSSCNIKTKSVVGVVPPYEYNRHTNHYQDQDLETTLKLTHRGTINIQAQNSVGNLEISKGQVDSSNIKLNAGKYRETIHFAGTNLEDDLDISVQQDPVASHSTKRSQSRIKELEEKIWGHRKSANVNRDVIDQVRITSTNYNDETNANIEDLNMTNDFDEKHIKQQSTMTNLAHLVQFISEKRQNGEQHEMSDTINLDNEEMDLSSFEKPNDQLANDLSGIKIFGQDSTYYSDNNTQALCNLDPKRIFCVSKYDAMNAAENSKHKNVTLTPTRSLLPVRIKKSDPTLGRTNISAHQSQDENTLPRFTDEAVSNIQDLIDITANLPQQTKTRQEICRDYINLTLSRFSGSTANSSNVDIEQIDQTSIKLVNSFGDMDEKEEKPSVSEYGFKYVKTENVDESYTDVDKIFTRKTNTHVPVIDIQSLIAKSRELQNQPSFTEIANEYKLRNLINSKRVSELQEPVYGPEKPSLRFLMNNYREQMMKEYSEKHHKEFGMIAFLPLIPRISVLLQNKLAERNNYWMCNDAYYNHGILVFTHYRVPCLQIKMLFEFFEETEFGELEFTSVLPMMSKTKILASTFELIQHLEFFKRVPSEMKNMCRRSDEILDFLDNLDSKIIQKNYEDILKLQEILINTNSKIWHVNDTGAYGITKTLIYNRTVYDIVIKINDLHITDISDVTVKPYMRPTNNVKKLSRGLDFLREFLEKPGYYLNFNK